jgi:hypothetical protein
VQLLSYLFTIVSLTHFRWFERWKERNQIHFSFGHWLDSIEACCVDKKGKYGSKNEGDEISGNGLEGAELAHGNILETVQSKSITQSQSQSKKIYINDIKTGQKTEQKIVKKTENNSENNSEKKPFEMDSKSLESAALTAGRNAVSCLRSSKKPSNAFPGTKVRQACLKIPLVYSHRSQRLPPIVSTGSVKRTLQGENSESNMNIEESEETSYSRRENFEKSKAAYYFPSLESENWLCVFQKECHTLSQY